MNIDCRCMNIEWTDLNIVTGTFADSMIDFYITTSDRHEDDIPKRLVLHLSKGNAKWLRDALDAAVKLNKTKGE